VLKSSGAESEDLREELRNNVAEQLGKPLKPEAVKFVDDLPKTRNAKIMRRVVRAAYLSEDPGDLSALENPRSVEAIRNAR
jgi:acetyl-CoA synthetase